MKNKYAEFKEKTSVELNAFYSNFAFFAFNDEQFTEGIQKLGIKRSELGQKLASIGGGYMLKTAVPGARELSERHNKKLSKLMEVESFAVSAFDYELGNHEWCITMDPSDGVEALGLTMNEVANSKHLAECLNKALKLQREYAMEHNW